MSSIGLYMALAGIISTVLHFMNMNLKLLMWIDMWGPTVGWAIRIGLIVVGGALFLLGAKGGEEEASSEAGA